MRNGINLSSLFKRDKKILYIILSIVIISIFTLTVVYAALSVSLNITGNAEVVASTWDVHFDNVKVKNGSVSGTSPTITGGTTVTFSTSLTTPGDFYEFTIDVVNNGTIDAMIDGISKTPTLTEEQAKYLNYIIEYQNGEAITTKQLVSVDSFVRLKVRLEFRNDITASDLPTTSETLNLAFTVNYVQSDGSGSSVIDDGVYKTVKVVSGDYDTPGSEICIEQECFNVISSDDTSVTMFAKKNITTSSNPVQSDAAPTVVFSTSGYWSSTTSKYPSYVYNSSASIYNYVENYKASLEDIGANIEEARLIDYDELVDLGCSAPSCSGAPSWVYDTCFWTGSANDSTTIWYIFSVNFGYMGYSNGSNFGVRPVIKILKTEF